MFHTRLRSIDYRVLACVFASSVLLAASPATADIFRCVAKDGLPLYQNFPCDLDSLGSLPSTSAATSKAPVSDPQTKRGGAQAANQTSPQTGEVSVNMTSEDVRALLGEPVEMVEDEPAEGGRISIWRYADGRSVQFDHKHRVLAVQRLGSSP
jgi:hypothetical protein